MVKYFVEIYKKKRDLVKYFILTYLDKSISFALPLSILFVLKDKSLYNLVEVIFSYATIALTVIELGFSNYLFWGYKHSDDKDKFIIDAQIFFRFVLLVYFFISFLIILWAYFYHYSNFPLLIVLVCIRTLFTFYTGFYSLIFRLKDTPSKIYIITILINISSLALLMTAYLLSWSTVIVYFFLPSAIVLVAIEIRYLIGEVQLFNFNAFSKFFRNSMMFAWPILLNTLFMSFMNNYAKIYAYGHLSQQETAQISYILRIGLIVQLTHVSFSSFYSKALFMDLNRKFNFRIFKQYNFVLLLSVILVAFAIFLTNSLFYSVIRIPFSLATCLFVLYILFWCYIGYLEIYFGVMNANKRMLYYSVISSLLYLALLKSFGDVNQLQLALFMVSSIMLNLILVIIGLVQLRVISFNFMRRRLSD